MSQVANLIDIEVYQQAKQGNTYCGDSYYYDETPDRFICALADGLGSGKYARESAEAVINVVKNNTHRPSDEVAQLCREELIGKRGVVLGILILDYQTEEIRFFSIGNIGLKSITKNYTKKRYIPSQGYLGGSRCTFKVVKAPLIPHMKFLMYTDGVAETDRTLEYFYYLNPKQTIQTYQTYMEPARRDDTTLIALTYHGD